jgi:glycosyltransferase involved in cell wall biosynthesis
VGGSDHLLLQVFSDIEARGARLLVFSTLAPLPNMGSTAAEYSRLTKDVFELPNELPTAAHDDATLHLLRSRRTQILMIVGSTATYRLLPRIKAELPQIKVVDHLYNTVGHLESNREFAQWIDFHIVANEEVRRALLDRGEDPARVEVIHHGIDLKRYDPAAVPRRDDLNGLWLRPDDRLVLFAGRISEEKGPLRFVEIADRLRELPRTVFAMIGDGPLARRVDELVRELGLESGVLRLGFVPDARPFLRRADVVVIPSDVDGLPLVSLQALALGTPLVASRVGALPDVIDEGRTGKVVSPVEIDEFADGVREVLDWPDRADVMSRCNAAVTARFSIEDVRERYFSVFNRLISGAAHGARAREAAS